MAASPRGKLERSEKVYCGEGQKSYETLSEFRYDYLDRHYANWRNYECPVRHYIPKTIASIANIARADFERLLEVFHSPIMCFSLQDSWRWSPHLEASFRVPQLLLIGPEIGIIAILTRPGTVPLSALVSTFEGHLEFGLRFFDRCPRTLPVRALIFDQENESNSEIYEWIMTYDGRHWESGDAERPHTSEMRHLLQRTSSIPRKLYEEIVLQAIFGYFEHFVSPWRNDCIYFSDVQIRRVKTNENETYSCVLHCASSSNTKAFIFLTSEQVQGINRRRGLLMGAAGTGKTTMLKWMLRDVRKFDGRPIALFAPRYSYNRYKDFIKSWKLSHCNSCIWPDDGTLAELVSLSRRLRGLLLPSSGGLTFMEIIFNDANSAFHNNKFSGDWEKAFEWLKKVSYVFVDDALIEGRSDEELFLSFTALLALLSACKLMSINFWVTCDGTTKYSGDRLRNFGGQSISELFQEWSSPGKFDFSFTVLSDVMRSPKNIFAAVYERKLFSDASLIPSNFCDMGPEMVRYQTTCPSFTEGLEALWDNILDHTGMLQENGFLINEIAILISSVGTSREESSRFLRQRWWNHSPTETPADGATKTVEKRELIFDESEAISMEWPAVIHASILPSTIDPAEGEYYNFQKYRFRSRAMIKLVSVTVRYTNPITKDTQPAGFTDREILGRGAGGPVYKYVHRSSSAVVAVKILNVSPGGLPDEARHEADLLRKISHPNVISVLGLIEVPSEHQIWLVMDLANGGSLEKYCTGEKRGELGTDQKIQIGVDCWSALHYLHKVAGIAHKDLKPANVLLHASDRIRAKICDFGTAKIKEHLTVTSQTTGAEGTVLYFPPERLDRQQNAALRDVYSMGATLIELFTGFFFWHWADTDPPGQQPDRGTVLMHLTVIRRGLSASTEGHGVDIEDQTIRCATAMLNIDCCPAIEDVLKRAVSFDRRNRPTAAEVLEIFRAAI